MRQLRRLAWLGTPRQARREGRRDARFKIPPDHWTRPAPSLTGLRRLGLMSQEDIGGAFFQALRKPLPRWHQAEVTVRHRRADLDRLTDELTPAEELAKSKLDAAEEEAANQPEELQPALRPWWRLVILPLLVVGEFFLTAVAFRILRLPVEEIAIIALTVNTALILLAHYIGAVLARADTVTGTDRAKREMQLARAAAGFLVLGIAAISLYRHSYLVNAQAQSGAGTQLGFMGGLGFFWLQVAVAAATAIFAFMTEPDPRAKRRLREQAAADQAVARLEQLRTAVAQARKQLQTAELDFVRVNAELELSSATHGQAAGRSREWYEYLTAVWQTANARHRQGEPSERQLSAELLQITTGRWSSYRPTSYGVPAAPQSASPEPATEEATEPADLGPVLPLVATIARARALEGGQLTGAGLARTLRERGVEVSDRDARRLLQVLRLPESESFESTTQPSSNGHGSPAPQEENA